MWKTQLDQIHLRKPSTDPHRYNGSDWPRKSATFEKTFVKKRIKGKKLYKNMETPKKSLKTH